MRNNNPPICFVLETDLLSKYGTPKEKVNIDGILQEQRDCKQFVKYQQGFTPKEHREMIDREAMLKWQAGREDADKKWQIKHLWMMAVVAGTFTILGGVIAAIISLLPSLIGH